VRCSPPSPPRDPGAPSGRGRHCTAGRKREAEGGAQGGGVRGWGRLAGRRTRPGR
jgi:hypothetical protein